MRYIYYIVICHSCYKLFKKFIETDILVSVVIHCFHSLSYIKSKICYMLLIYYITFQIFSSSILKILYNYNKISAVF